MPNNKKTSIHLVCAARPNFMKIAPLYHELKKADWADPVIVHTGQHYDIDMSDVFFQDLNLPEPHIHLGVGSGSHAYQTGNVLIAYEKVIVDAKPDMVVVVGDVNSTIACSLAAIKINYDSPNILGMNRPFIVHLEAGLRSFDRTMPEEINRILTDAISDLLLTPSPDADENLLNEGVAKDKILRVGNIMIDSLEMLRDKIESLNTYERYGLDPGTYGLVTIHRPANVDDVLQLEKICRTLKKVSESIPLLFPIHPRTRNKLKETGLDQELADATNLHLTKPLPYAEFMNLVFNSGLVITDSGGIQEETTYLGIPCFTLRPNTERPVTITQGTNELCKLEDLYEKVSCALEKRLTQPPSIDLWDGKTASRITKYFEQLLYS